MERKDTSVFHDAKPLSGWSKVRSNAVRLATMSALAQRLEKGIGQSASVLFLFTPGALDHASVLLELHWATKRKIPIITQPVVPELNDDVDYGSIAKKTRDVGASAGDLVKADVEKVLEEFNDDLAALEKSLSGALPNILSLPKLALDSGEGGVTVIQAAAHRALSTRARAACTPYASGAASKRGVRAACIAACVRPHATLSHDRHARGTSCLCVCVGSQRRARSYTDWTRRWR
jgi:hypothetical protein